ncbi:glycerophosphodiester phosphodiesterase family protein [Marinoscillum furvescens]|uniref:Glycerophosphoryl diester phosphodiesterase n=1 Tax=Marinoscillum furvescens DSM 4134 TaxID=1122208 RepID=A0A3D9KXF9_MARFU|nr:glycerophosphodiester phosphodiesterase family protein [Marinoscillum furvescens]RED93598.1 glycerophosphoryl diester phosphodiesterase [Marinoscillum furvescens DSM 4134]
MKRLSLLIALTCTLFSCVTKQQKPLDIQGHRGARGLYPENSIPGFIHALDLGVTTLEMDLAVTKDGQLVVSHEPYMSAVICLDSLGGAIPSDSAQAYNVFQMTYQQVAQFDCGSIDHPRFPEQKKLSVVKPLLTQVIDSAETFAKNTNQPLPFYNIEIKSKPEGDGRYHPNPADFSDLVYRTVEGLLPWNRVTIQSFDFRVLQYIHKTYPEVNLALLIENKLPFQHNIDSIGFVPQIYSCHFPLLSRQTVADIQEQGMQVIPWTVNDPEDMTRLIDWGVDGLITDYPNRYNELNNE